MNRFTAVCLSIVTSLAISSARICAAQTATPTPTATATPGACQSLQNCVDTSVPAAVATCAGENAQCTDTNTDKLAVTAGIIASRATANCSKAKTKFACNACYQRAKLPLVFRFDGKLFHGLLAQSKKIIEQNRQAACSSLTNSRSR